MDAVKRAVNTIGDGIEKALKSVGQFAGGLATLDLKGAAEGLKSLASAGMELARGAFNLTPAALAANTLMQGALDKVLQKAEKVATSVTDKVVDTFEGGLSNIKDGVVTTAKGLAHGDIGQVFGGVTQTALGALDTASNFGPGGIAKNIARVAVDAAVDTAVEKVTSQAAKVLDPHGTSTLGGIAVDVIGAAAGGAATGRGSSAGGALRNGASNAAGAARDMAIESSVQAVTSKAATTLDPNGTSALGGIAANVAGAAVGGAMEGRGSTPTAIMRSGASHAAGAARDMAIQCSVETATNQAAKVLDPHGTSGLGGIAVDVVGAAAGGALEGRGGSLGAALRSGASHAAVAASQTAIQSSVDLLSGKVTDLLMPAGLGSNVFGGALQQAVGSGVNDAMQIAVASGIRHAVGALPLHHASGLAELGLAGNGAPGDTRQQLRQSLHDTIEGAVRTAAGGAIDHIVDASRQHVARGLGAPQNILQERVQDSIDNAVRQVTEAVVAAVFDTATKAASQARGTPQPTRAATDQPIGA